MKDSEKASEDLLWLTNEQTLNGQVQVYRAICKRGTENYRKFLESCEDVDAHLTGEDRRAKTLFRDSLMLQGQIHYRCFAGAELICESLQAAFENDYKKAFYCAERHGKNTCWQIVQCAKESTANGRDSMPMSALRM